MRYTFFKKKKINVLGLIDMQVCANFHHFVTSSSAIKVEKCYTILGSFCFFVIWD